MAQSEYILKLENYRQFPNDLDRDCNTIITELEFVAIRKLKCFTDEQKFKITNEFSFKKYFLFLEKSIRSLTPEHFIISSYCNECGDINISRTSIFRFEQSTGFSTEFIEQYLPFKLDYILFYLIFGNEPDDEKINPSFSIRNKFRTHRDI